MVNPRIQVVRFGRRGALSAILGGLVVLAIGLVVASASASRRPAAKGRQVGAAIGFSHAVVVDEQRPGFEPDVKVDSTGAMYVSMPFGFSTTQSFLWASHDDGNSYQFVPGTIGPGKPATCIGGGDTDLFLDSGNALYFSDLQGLDNITNSVSTDQGATWTTNCAGAPNTPDDRMWFTGTGSLAGGNLVLYQDYDATETSVNVPSPPNSGGNQLVETVSTDGTHFLPVVNSDLSALTGDCAGAAVQDCVTDNEGISGNQVVDPTTGNVYIAHTTTEGDSSGAAVGVRIAEGKITMGTPTTGVWSESPNLDGSLCPNSTCVDANGNAEETAGENFATIARDAAGYLYVTFTAGPVDHASSSDPNFGGYTAPEQIYVVHSLEPAGADPSTLTWSAPQKITGTGISSGTNTFPWIVAGSDGRVDVAWYHTAEVSEPGTCIGSGSGTCTLYGAGEFTKAEWSVEMAQSLNAHDGTPTYTSSDVSETYTKHGQICTNGLGCTTGGDRSLGDFLQVNIDKQGAALVSYVLDTSADTSAGEDAGPVVVSRQLAGPSLLASVGTVSQGAGPGVPMGSVTDPTGDAYYSANSSRSPASSNLDLTGASLANGPNRTLVATIDVKDLSSLAVSPTIGGPDGSWMLRWTVVDPGTTGNGDIYYAGMDNNAGAGGVGTPTFFAGDTAGIPPANPGEHTKYLTYPQTDLLSSSQASYDAKTGVITMNIPLSDVGNPPAGTTLYSATAFSATSTTPQSSTTLFNLTDATTPFELVIGAPGTVGSPTSAPSPLPSGYYKNKPGCPVATGKLTTTGLGPLSLGMTRTRARQILTHSSTRGRQYFDFFCLKPIGIRAAYPSPALLRRIPRKQRRALKGKIVLLLTSDHLYALRGVHPDTKLSKVARRLRVGPRIRVGLNDWYLAPNGSSIGVLKVRHGLIEEVGLANKHLAFNSRGGRALLSSLR
jgi:hypothetical protein